MKKHSSGSALAALLILILTVITAGCVSVPAGDDYDHGHDHDHDHEAFGLNIYLVTDGEQQPEPMLKQTITGVEGSLTAASSPQHYILFFTDEDGHEFIPDLSEHSIDIEPAAETGSVDIMRDEKPANANKFSISLPGGSDADITVILKHQGSKEFVSKPLPVTFTPIG